MPLFASFQCPRVPRQQMKNCIEFITSHFYESFFFNLLHYCACIQQSLPEKKSSKRKIIRKHHSTQAQNDVRLSFFGVVERKQMPHKGAINSFAVCGWMLVNGSRTLSKIHLILFIWCCELCPKIIQCHYSDFYDAHVVVADSIFNVIW